MILERKRKFMTVTLPVVVNLSGCCNSSISPMTLIFLLMKVKVTSSMLFTSYLIPRMTKFDVQSIPYFTSTQRALYVQCTIVRTVGTMYVHCTNFLY